MGRRSRDVFVVVLVSVSAFGCSGDESPSEGMAGRDSGETGTAWCQVSELLQAKCQVCHSGKGNFGAPFPLVTYEDTQVEDHAGARYERMQTMIEADLMPPSPEQTTLGSPPDKLTEDEKELVLTWIEEGARPVGGTDCP